MIGDNSTADSGECDSAIVKSPIDVRLRFRKCAPPPNKVPRSTTATYPGLVLDQIATISYVSQAVAAIDLTPYATKANPVFTGVPQAPTAATNTNNQQLATTAFVRNLVASEYGLWQGSAKYVSTGDPSPSTGNDGDFWFKYQP